MTYSVVAADPASGLVGVAAQSHHVAVGAQLAFAEPNVAAVAVQSYADRAYGPAILEAVRGGASGADALASRVAADPHSSRAQVAVVTASAETAVHTGSRCVPAAGHTSAAGASAQANMVSSSRVWADALKACVTSTGHLTERLLAALDAAEAAGGDLRGRQSAVLLVVGGDGTRLDVRVDDALDPLPELRRLAGLQLAARQMSAAFALAAKGGTAEAVQMLMGAQGVFGPDNLEPTAWAAVLLARAGDTRGAGGLLRLAASSHPNWTEFVRRLATVGLFPDDAVLLDSVTGATR